MKILVVATLIINMLVAVTRVLNLAAGTYPRIVTVSSGSDVFDLSVSVCWIVWMVMILLTEYPERK